MWRLVYYATRAGDRPVREYIRELDADERARVTYDLDLLETFGLELRAPHVRALGNKLWELRTRGRTQHRVVYFAASGQRLVLLHAFTKRTPKAPPAEIDLAQRRLADFLVRERERKDDER